MDLLYTAQEIKEGENQFTEKGGKNKLRTLPGMKTIEGEVKRNQNTLISSF